MDRIMETKREFELDLLRIIAMIAVIFAHVGGDTTASNNAFNISYFLNAIIIWHVPCYVMISGRFWLDPSKDININKIRNGIKKILFAFIFWNVIYQIVYISQGKYGVLNWKGIILDSGALVGPYHFWFLWMIIGLYLITPFLRKITQSKKLMEYFIILFLIVEFINRFGEYIPYVGGIFRSLWTLLGNREAGIMLVLGYSGYYILGYYLHKYPLKKNFELLLYVIGGILLFGGAVYRGFLIDLNEWQQNLYSYLSPNIVIFASAIYTFFIKRVSKLSLSSKSLLIINKMQSMSFGIYLVHALVIELLSLLFPVLYATTINEIIMRLIRTTIVFAISTFIIIIVRTIPKIGKKVT